MRLRTTGALLTAAMAAGSIASTGASAQNADAQLMNTDGKAIGNVALNQLEQGVQVYARAEGVEPGTHAFHIHETGACEPPDFESAGGHFNPTDADHGWDNPNGPHAGDLPNVHVQDDGVLAVQYFTDKISLREGETQLFDEDGSAVVMHTGADDYQTEPAGDAGKRIACGVIEAPE